MSNLTKGIITGIIGLGFSYLSITTASSSTHKDCTHWVRAGEERECVGHWVTVAGTDWVMVFVWGLLAFGCFIAAKGFLKP